MYILWYCMHNPFFVALFWYGLGTQTQAVASFNRKSRNVRKCQGNHRIESVDYKS